jgi:hypothetical protein
MPRSHLAEFGLEMRRPIGLQEARVPRHFASMIGLLAVLAPVVALASAPACAQTNIDQGKSAAQIFEADCAVCHKGTRGLANGKNSLTLSSFLREHYTSSREQASALAAYVLNGGGGESRPAAEGRGRLGTERAKTPNDEAKPAGRSAKSAKQEAKPEGRPETKPEAKPEEAAPATANLQRPDEGEAKPERPNQPEEPAAMPVRKPPGAATVPRGKQTSVVRGRQKDAAPPANVAPAPTTVLAEPTPSNTDRGQETKPAPSSAAAAPASDFPTNAPPVPRDDIPD